MISIKLIFIVVCVMGVSSAQVFRPILVPAVKAIASQLLDFMVPKILLSEYENVSTKEGYRFSYKTSDGSYRDEIGMFINPGTPNQELVVMGAYSYRDGDTETEVMYTSDKNGYKPRVQTKNRGVSLKCLMNCVG